MKVFICVLALAVAQCQAGNIGVISAIAASNLQSHSAGHSYSAPQPSYDHSAGHSYSVPQPSYDHSVGQSYSAPEPSYDHSAGHSYSAPQPSYDHSAEHSYSAPQPSFDHSVAQSYSAPQQSHDAGYSYSAAPANPQIPIPSYSSGPLQQAQPAPHQIFKHIQVHQGLQTYPDQGFYQAPATPQYFKVLKITHQEGHVPNSDGQQQHIQVIRVHHGDHSHGHGHSAPAVGPIVQQHQLPAQTIKTIKVIHDHGPISQHNQIAQPIVQNQAPLKVIKVVHENGPINHGYAPAAAAPIESGWAPAAPPSSGW